MSTATDGADAAMIERAAVVAWLRERAAHWNESADRMRAVGFRDCTIGDLARASTLRSVADGIEAGDHLRAHTLLGEK